MSFRSPSHKSDVTTVEVLPQHTTNPGIPFVGLVVPDPNATGLPTHMPGSLIVTSGNCPGIAAKPKKPKLIPLKVFPPVQEKPLTGLYLDMVIPQARSALLQSLNYFKDDIAGLAKAVEENRFPSGLNANLSYRLSDILMQYQKLDSLLRVEEVVKDLK